MNDQRASLHRIYKKKKIMEKNLKFLKSRKKVQKNKNAKNVLLKKENYA